MLGAVGQDFIACHDYRGAVVDSLSEAERSERMSHVRGRDTKPEMLVRRLVHRMGFRYRLHERRLPGAPDLVFKSRRKVIFIHGCFWHRHSDPSCKLARMPKSKLDFWQTKLEGNRARDARNQSDLDAMGWRYLVVWECELRHREQLENKLLAFLSEGESA
jgi:DNA mismatch endonuclease (patch repair protein)